MSKDVRFIQAELIVTDYEVAHDEITQELGLEATRTFAKGDIARRDPSSAHDPVRYPHNAWARTLVQPNKGYLEENISQALKEIAKFECGVKTLSSKYHVELSIFGSSANETRQAFHIDKELATRLIEYGIELDVDIYPAEEEVFDAEQKRQKMHDMLIS
jgi:hypothetical protein